MLGVRGTATVSKDQDLSASRQCLADNVGHAQDAGGCDLREFDFRVDARPDRFSNNILSLIVRCMLDRPM
jgi:hypothetical protein